MALNLSAIDLSSLTGNREIIKNSNRLHLVIEAGFIRVNSKCLFIRGVQISSPLTLKSAGKATRPFADGLALFHPAEKFQGLPFIMLVCVIIPAAARIMIIKME